MHERPFNPHGNKTADGKAITKGMRVWDYNLDTGVVIADASDGDYGNREDHWYDVQLDKGGTSFMNGTRMTTRFNGKLA